MFASLSNRQSGFTLLEVLISIFVVLVGLLGVASMIPAGRFELTEARKADMGSNISRALLQSVIAQVNKEDLKSTGHYYVVQQDYAAMAKYMAGFSSLPGITFNDDYLLNGDDDLLTTQDEDGKTLLFGNNQWSGANKSFDQTAVIGTGDYAGFATLIPLPNGYYEVSAAVSYRSRDVDDPSLYGSVPLSRYNILTGDGEINSTPAVNLKRGQYVLLNKDDEWHWTKIDFIFNDDAKCYITLSDPSWRESGNGANISNSAKIYVLGDVVSVSSRVVRLGE